MAAVTICSDFGAQKTKSATVSSVSSSISHDDRGWDGWMASLTQWTWVWVSSGSWWWTGKPGVLQSMGHKESDMTERLNWLKIFPTSLEAKGQWDWPPKTPSDLQTKSEEIILGYIWNEYILSERHGLFRHGGTREGCLTRVSLQVPGRNSMPIVFLETAWSWRQTQEQPELLPQPEKNFFIG